MRTGIIVLLLGIVISGIQAQPAGYNYGKTIIIQVSQVSGTSNHTDFPVLISVSDNDLRTTANGGHVTNSNGYDIVFYTSDCLTKLDHQIESYTASSGALVAWVRVPTLSISVNTVIQMYYGNSSVTADPSVSATWNSNYKSVWHFNNSVNDNTANGNNLTDNSTTNLATAKIAAGRDLNNSTNILSSAAGQYLRLANGFFAGISNFTFEGWVNLDRSATNWERIFDFGQNTNVNFFLTPSTGTGSPAETRARITINTATNEQGPIVTNTTNTGSWIHWAVVLDNAAGSLSIYRNGTLLGNATGITLTPSSIESSTANYFGRSQYAADHYIDAKFDEFRISTSARSAGWIVTSYNNQNNPSTFYSISSESASGTLCSILPVELLYFKATPYDNTIDIYWATATEINNDYFTLERSADARTWSTLKTIPGAGTSMEEQRYSVTDYDPNRRNYYRLMQTDFDGTSSYSSVVIADLDTRDIVIYTLPENQLIIEGVTNAHSIKFFNSIGRAVQLSGQLESGKMTYSSAELAPGIYIALVQTESGEIYVKKIYIE
jgi:biopolymer transport protein ExbB